MSLPNHAPLSADELRAAGIPTPWSFGMSDRVRFGEIDVLGHVNNTAYLRWFENLRIHYIEAYGLGNYAEDPPKIVVKSLGLDFRSEVKMNDPYILTGRTVEMRSSSFTMEYAVFVRGVLTTTGHALMVNLNRDNSKQPLSEAFRQTLIARDGAIQA